MTLSEALEQVDLEPGKTYRCRVQGMRVELKVCSDLHAEAAAVHGTSIDADVIRDDDLTPNDDWVELPAPEPSLKIKLKQGRPMTVMVLDQTDDQIAPE